jgi:hypothetical protein
MKSALEEEGQKDLLSRIDRIKEGATPRWGKFTAGAMLTHLIDSSRMATGDLVTRSKNLPIRYFPLKQLFIYLLPFPKGLPTSPELLRATPEPVDAAKLELQRRIADLPRFAREGRWPQHPAFGNLSTRAWGVLTYRHFDHHLRQFGV